MGGLFGDEKKSSSEVQPFSGDMKNKYEWFEKQAREQLGGPKKYDGALSAPVAQGERDALAMMVRNISNQALSDTGAGKYLDVASNPYLAQQAAEIKKQMGESFGRATDAIDARVNRSGFWGGSQHQALMEKSRNELAARQGEALGNLYGSQYDRERARQVQALGLQSDLAGQVLGAAGTIRGTEDADLGRKYQRWLSEQGLNQQALQNYMNVLQLGRNPRETRTESGGGLGDLLGTAVGAWAGGGFKPFWKGK